MMANEVETPPTEPRLFDVVAMIFVGTLLISNIAAQKLFAFGSVTFTAGVIVFPITYIFGDVLTEVYGYHRTRRVIWTGFLCNALMACVLWIAVWLPPAKGWPLQEQFATILGFVPRIVLASVIGYWVGEFSNSYVLAKMKIVTQGRHLWMRTISSTVVGEFVDTTAFVLVAFTTVVDSSLLVKTIIYGWLFKVAYEALATPLTYAVVGYLKRVEGFDHFDRDTNFNPFKIGKGPSRHRS